MISDNTSPIPPGYTPAVPAGGSKKPTTRPVSETEINTAFAHVIQAKQMTEVSKEDNGILVGFFRNRARHAEWLNKPENAETCDKLLRAITRLYILSDTVDPGHQCDHTSQSIGKILQSHYTDLASRTPDDLLLVTDDGTKINASALLLMHASKTFDKVLTSRFDEGERLFTHYPVVKDGPPIPIRIHKVSANALATFVTFLKTGQLQHDHTFTADELRELVENIPYWELSSPTQQAALKGLLLEHIIKSALTPETALEWYGIASTPPNDWPELRNACLTTLRTLHSADDLEELQIAIMESYFSEPQRASLLRSVISQVTLYLDGTTLEEKQRLYRLLSLYGATEQVTACVASMIGPLSDEALFAAFGVDGPPPVEGVPQEQVIRCYKTMLAERLRLWTLILGNWNGDAASRTLKGRKKAGLFAGRETLNERAKAGLERCLTLPSLLVDQELISHLSPQLQAWYQRQRQS